MTLESVVINLMGFVVGAPVGFGVGWSWRERHDRKILKQGLEGKHYEPD